jgi:hypothetical protein
MGFDVGAWTFCISTFGLIDVRGGWLVKFGGGTSCAVIVAVEAPTVASAKDAGGCVTSADW